MRETELAVLDLVGVVSNCSDLVLGRLCVGIFFLGTCDAPISSNCPNALILPVLDSLAAIPFPDGLTTFSRSLMLVDGGQ